MATSVELSQALMNSLTVNIINYGNPSTDQTIGQSGLFPSNQYSINFYAQGRVYIMKGTKPVDPKIINIPLSDVLLDFSVSSGSLLIQPTVNPVVISSTFLPAIASGTATWFIIAACNNPGNLVFQSATGDVGTSGSGADLEISNTTVTAGQPYRILNLRLLFLSSWSIA